MKKINLGFYVAAFASSILGVVACSSTTENPIDGDASVAQCKVDADCDNLGGELRGRACKEGVCVVRDIIVEGDAAAVGCVDNATCTNQNSGRPSVCPSPGAKCVNIGNDDCEVIGDWNAQDKIVFGGMFAEKSTELNFTVFGSNHKKNVRFALEELSQGLSAGIGGKKVVGVLCNSKTAPSGSDTATLNHLLDVVDVDVLFSHSAEDVLAAGAAYASGKRARPSFCLDGSMDLRAIAGPSGSAPNLYSRLQPTSDSVPIFQWALADFEARKRAGGFTGAVKVAMIGWEGAYFSADIQKLQAILNFNGKNVGDNGTDGNFKYLASPSNPSTSAWFAKLDEITAFQPDIIIALALDDVTRASIPYLEASAGVKKPRYIVNTGVLGTQFPSVAGTNAELMGRFWGVTQAFVSTAGPNLSTLLPYFGRYASRYPTVATTESPNFWGYEMVHAAAWGIAGAGPLTGRLTSADIDRGFANVFDAAGTKTLVGPGSLGMMGLVSNGGKVMLTGLLSDFGWSTSLGHPTGLVTASTCLTPIDGVARNVDNGVVYVPGPNVTVGSNLCPLPL